MKFETLNYQNDLSSKMSFLKGITVFNFPTFGEVTQWFYGCLLILNWGIYSQEMNTRAILAVHLGHVIMKIIRVDARNDGLPDGWTKDNVKMKQFFRDREEGVYKMRTCSRYTQQAILRMANFCLLYLDSKYGQCHITVSVLFKSKIS